MTGGGERALLTRLLRESVLTLCREAMASHRRFSVDGIVLISLDSGDDDEDDDSNDRSGKDRCTPIVVRIHEQLARARDPLAKNNKRRCDDREGEVLVGQIQHEMNKELLNKDFMNKDLMNKDLPMDKKSQIMRRVFQEQLQSGQRELSRPNPNLSPSSLSDCTPLPTSTPPAPSYRPRSVSENAPLRKMPKLENEREGGEGREMDGHWSDPTPDAGRIARHSTSTSSEDSGRGTIQRGSVSSLRDVNSPVDPPLLSRAESQSPEERPVITPSSASTTALNGSKGTAPQARYRLSCRKCEVGIPDVLSLERHNLQEHACFTCHLCYATFTARNNLKRHARTHTGPKPYKCHTCEAAFFRRDDLKTHRQRHSHAHNNHRHAHRSPTHAHSNYKLAHNGLKHAHANHNHAHNGRTERQGRPDLSCQQCPFAAADPLDLSQHVKTHMACPPCCLTFGDVSAYKAHMRQHNNGDSALRAFSSGEPNGVQLSLKDFVNHQLVRRLSEAAQNHYSQEEKESFLGRQNSLDHSRQARDTNLSTGKPDCYLSSQDENKAEEDMRKSGEDSRGREDSTSGRGQSWCTECQVGFPDEAQLMQHITHTHENDTRRQGPQPQHSDQDAGETESASDRKESSSETREESEELDVETVPGEGDEDRKGEESSRAAGEGSDWNEGSLESRPTRSEALNVNDVSSNLEDASPRPASNASHRESPQAQPQPRQASPLRRVPLPLTQPPSSPAPSPVAANNSTGNLVKLVKPTDFIISTGPYMSSPSPSAATTTPSEIPPAHSSGGFRSPGAGWSLPRHIDNFLHVERTSPPHPRLHSPLPNHGKPDHSFRLKKEPTSDHDDPSHRDYPEEYHHGPHRDYLTPPRGLPTYGFPTTLHPYRVPPTHSPDLPMDCSMSRSNSSSPRSAGSGSSDGSSSTKSPSFEKVVTPEVMFRDRSHLVCPAKDCGQEFSSFSDLEEHSARVHRRHLCDYCGTSFTAKPNRDRHVRYHTGVKPYKCHLCSQAFFRGDDLKYHRTTKHNREPSHFVECPAMTFSG